MTVLRHPVLCDIKWGVVAAAVFGFIAIKGMLKLIRRISMNWFALYTFLLGTFLLLDRYVFKIWMA